MHTVDLLEEALLVGRRLGFDVRQEWLDGGTGGACQLRGRKWLFVDLALSPADQLDQVREALLEEPALYQAEMSEPLRMLLGVRRSA